MPTYGSTYQVYGSHACGNCGVPHARFMHVKETSRSRFKLMHFMAEITARHQNGGIFTHNMGSQRFMLGLLISGNQILVAASGNNNNKITATANALGYTVCPAIVNTAGNRSRVNRLIPQPQYAGTQVMGDPNPGNCAAPRLIQHATTLPAVKANWRAWEMSEVFFHPKTSHRTASAPYWVHGLSAHSCGTCENLVPILMCPRP